MRHYTIHMILAMAICLASISCSDSDDTSTQNQQQQERVTDNDSVRYVKTVSLMFDYDSVSVTYQPRYGEVLESVTPTIYSLGFNNKNEARRWFLDHCVPKEEADSIDSLKQDNMTLSFGKYGEVRYEKSGQTSSYATIYLNFPEMKLQTQINLIPLELWSKNAYSPFFVEDIVKRKDNQQYYICVRACEGGRKGILISFGDYWSDANYKDRGYIYYYSFSQGSFWLPKGASLDAWNALAQMYDSHRGHFKAYMKALAEMFPNSGLLKSDAIKRLANDMDADEKYPYPTEPQGCKYFFSSIWDLTENMVYVGKNTVEMKDGMPRFKTKNVGVAGCTWWGRGWWNSPAHTQGSHSEEFTLEQSSADLYVRVFNAQEAND